MFKVNFDKMEEEGNVTYLDVPLKMRIKPNHFAGREEIRTITKDNGVTYPVRTNRGRFFFPDEWKAFYEQLTNKQKITFNFLINTGARIMEIQHIEVRDVDFERGNVVLRVTKRIINRVGIQKKGTRTVRILSISTQFTKYLKGIVREYKLGSEDKFPVLSTPAANTAMKKALDKAGIKDYKMFSLHNCRKTLETWLMALNIDNFKIVKHFGHSIAIALKHYVSPDIFSHDERREMREIIGDLFEK